MLESHMIQNRGFRNIGDAQPTGFEVAVRCPYYRGIWASLLEGAAVTVDGETYESAGIQWALSGETFTDAELAEADDKRWAFEEPALLRVDRPGGLDPGLHDVEVAISWRWSYIPVEFQPTTFIAHRKLVLVR